MAVVNGVASQSRTVQSAPSVRRRCWPEENDHGISKEREDTTSRSQERMGPAQAVGQGFFPLDEQLALLPGSLTPQQQEHLAHLASWMPFARAARMLQRLLGVQVSEATVRRSTEQAGVASQQEQTAASQSPAAEPTMGQEASAKRLLMSGDGAYVPLVKGEWAQVRTLVIGEVAPGGGPEQEEITSALSYFSRMVDAATFAQLAEVETRRRQLLQAQEVCAVTDGAEWLQGFIDLHRPDALRILDFPHAAQRFGMIAEASQEANSPLADSWVQEQCHRLKHEGPEPILLELHTLPTGPAQAEHIGYLQKRVAHMQYPAYRAAGWPIGSGCVESANKVVMQARLKGAGMRWAPSHVNPMLALRTAVCNERWDEAWQALTTWQRNERSIRRRQKAQTRLTALIKEFLILLMRFRPIAPPTPAKSRPALMPAATLPGSSRPSAHHVWKRTPACRPKLLAKK